MKVSFESGEMEVYMFLPMAGIIYHPDIKTLEIGIYFIKYFLTINIKFK